MSVLSIKKGSENYTAQVIRIKDYRKHPNADKLWIVTVNFNNVITGVEPNIGDLHVYFPVLSVLNKDFIREINGYSSSTLNANPEIKGFFSDNPRVRPIKLRGEKSEGYLHPVEDVEKFFNYSKLSEGNEFTTINGVDVCKKFVVRNTPGTPSEKGEKKQKKSRLVDGMFILHNDTSNLRKNIHKINPDDLIEISYKKHGTSVVIGNVPVKRELKWWENLAKKVGIPVTETEYDVIVSSRKVIKNASSNAGFYNEDIWTTVKKEVGHLIPKNYTLYGEIIGHLKNGGYIQKNYDYGCKDGEHKFYVYKITTINPDGFVINLSTPQIKEFCDRYGLLFSDTLLYYGYAKDLFPALTDTEEDEWRIKFLKNLEDRWAGDTNCYMCVNKVPQEGIVVVKQDMFEYEAYKLKSFAFLSKTENEEAELGISNIEDIN